MRDRFSGARVTAARQAGLDAASATDTAYFVHIMPALFLASLGLGMSAITLTLAAVHEVPDDATGVASAFVNMSQQIGAALGLAVFTTVALSSTNERLSDAALVLKQAGSQKLVVSASAALSQGYGAAFATGAAMLLAAAGLLAVAVNTRRMQADRARSS